MAQQVKLFAYAESLGPMVEGENQLPELSAYLWTYSPKDCPPGTFSGAHMPEISTPHNRYIHAYHPLRLTQIKSFRLSQFGAWN